MKKLNNDGFSFIEVLVALSILIVVSIPILISINHTMKLNAQSKVKQRAVSVEQSIIEKLGTLNVPEVIDKFNQTDASKFDIVSSCSGYKGLKNDYTTAKSYNVKDRLDKYYFGIYGVKQGGKEYDARITYSNTGTTSKIEEINEKSVPGVVTMGEETQLSGDTLSVVNKLYKSGTAQKQILFIDMYENKTVVTTMLDGQSDVNTFNVEYNKLRNIYVYITPVNDKTGYESVSNAYSLPDYNLSSITEGNNVCVKFHLAQPKYTDGGKKNLVLVKVDNNNPGVTNGGNFSIDFVADSGMRLAASYKSYINIYGNVVSEKIYSNGFNLNTNYVMDGLGDFHSGVSNTRNRMYEVNVEVYEHTDALDFGGKKVSSMTSSIIN